MKEEDPGNLAGRRANHKNMVTWSKNGFIAYCTPDNTLKLTYLERVDELTWQLATPEDIVVRSPNDSSHTQTPINLLSWSNLSTDLAVADVHGNFYIYLAGVGVVGSESRLVIGPSGTSNNSGNGYNITSQGKASGALVVANGNGNPSTINGTTSTASKTSTGPTTNGHNSNDGSYSSGNAAKSTPMNRNGSDQTIPNLSYELTSYNNLEMIYRDVEFSSKASMGSSTSESRHKVVAFKWMNVEKLHVLNKPAVKTSQSSSPNSPSTYTYGVLQSPSVGLTHPIPTKQACIALRQNGNLQLYYQGEHKVEYHKTEIKIENLVINFTKASMGFTKDKRLIITALDTISNTIKTYSITVDWGHLSTSVKKQKIDPHYQTPLSERRDASMAVTFLYEMNPIPAEVDDGDDGNDDRMDIDSEAIKIEDQQPDSSSQSPILLGDINSIDLISPSPLDSDSDLEIFISYKAYLSNSLEIPDQTSIYRYKIGSKVDEISNTFSELGNRKNVQQLENSKALNALILQNKLSRYGTLKSIETGFSDSLILLVYESNTVDIISRDSLSIISKVMEKGSIPDKISSLFELGYNFPRFEDQYSSKPMVIGFSPNLTSMVYADFTKTDKLSIKTIERSFEEITPREIYVLSVGYALRHAYTCYTNTYSEDLLAFLQLEISKFEKFVHTTLTDKKAVSLGIAKFVDSIICESHKAISFQLDVFGKESVDKLLSNPPLQKLLSLQLVLGELPRQRSAIRDIAWIVLNLRSTSFGIMFLLSFIYRQISKKKPSEDSLQDSITRAECITSLIGNAQWLIDLVIYFNQELINLSLGKGNFRSSVSIQDSIVLPIILSKIPRLFLMYALSSIGKTNEILKKLHKDLSDSQKVYPPMKEAFNRYFTIYNSSPLSITKFEEYLRKCDTFVTAEVAKSASGRGKTYSMKLEQRIVCQGDISDEIVPIAQSVIAMYPSVMENAILLSNLFFYDLDWLSIGMFGEKQDQGSGKSVKISETYKAHVNFKPRLHLRNSEYVDGLRKIILNFDHLTKKESITEISKAKFRKCTRCRALSYINDPLAFATPSTIGLWTMVFQRTCVCGSAWVTIT